MNKTLLLEKCHVILSERIAAIQDAIQNAEVSLIEETKSSAGDKYETSREMIQQDLDRLGVQLQAVLGEKEILQRIDSQQHAMSVGLGSLVYTNDGLCYFIAIGMGKVELDKHACYVISLASPLGKVLQGKFENEFFEINNHRRKIDRVI